MHLLKQRKKLNFNFKDRKYNVVLVGCQHLEDIYYRDKVAKTAELSMKNKTVTSIDSLDKIERL